jgi:probable HAF family extracellular repeat protein
MNGGRGLARVGVAALVASMSIPTAAAASVAAPGSCGPRVIDLGTLGGPNSEVDGGNRRGDFVGAADTADGHTRAVAWLGGRIVDLGVDGWGAAINEARLVVGNSDSGAFSWYRGTVRTLPMPSWAVGSYVRRVNESGTASGAVYTASGVSVPVVWLGLARVRALPVPAGFTDGEGLGINDAGDVVGDVSSDSEQVAWEWDENGTSHALAPEASTSAASSASGRRSGGTGASRSSTGW